MFGLKVFPQESLKFACGNQGPLMDLTAISMWYVLKQVTGLQPPIRKISCEFPPPLTKSKTSFACCRRFLEFFFFLDNHTKHS